MDDLKTLTFQKDIGSFLEKTHRIEKLVESLGVTLGLTEAEMENISQGCRSLQSGPGDKHGRRDDLASRGHWAVLCSEQRGGIGGRPLQSLNIICRVQRMILCLRRDQGWRSGWQIAWIL